MIRHAAMLLTLVGCTGAEPPEPDPRDIDLDADGYDSVEDCDDENPDIHPGADERCNGTDDDCNGVVDENPVDSLRLFWDSDRDGYGVEDSLVRGYCEPTEQAAVKYGDCEPWDPDIHPEAEEICFDNKDNDCDEETRGSCTWPETLTFEQAHLNWESAGSYCIPAHDDERGEYSLVCRHDTGVIVQGGPYFGGRAGYRGNFPLESDVDMAVGQFRSFDDHTPSEDVITSDGFVYLGGDWDSHEPSLRHFHGASAQRIWSPKLRPGRGGSNVIALVDDTLYVMHSWCQGCNLLDTADLAIQGVPDVEVLAADLYGDEASEVVITGAFGTRIVDPFVTVGEVSLDDLPVWSADRVVSVLHGERTQLLMADGTVYRSPLADSMAESEKAGAIDPSFMFLGAGDFDGDGADDVLLRTTSDPSNPRALILAGPITGERTLEDAVLTVSLPPDPNAEVTSGVIADLDGDGIPDLALVDPFSDLDTEAKSALYVFLGRAQ